MQTTQLSQLEKEVLLSGLQDIQDTIASRIKALGGSTLTDLSDLPRLPKARPKKQPAKIRPQAQAGKPKGKRTMSAQQRAKIAEAQRVRWALKRAAESKAAAGKKNGGKKPSVRDRVAAARGAGERTSHRGRQQAGRNR